MLLAPGWVSDSLVFWVYAWVFVWLLALLVVLSTYCAGFWGVWFWLDSYLCLIWVFVEFWVWVELRIGFCWRFVWWVSIDCWDLLVGYFGCFGFLFVCRGAFVGVCW